MNTTEQKQVAFPKWLRVFAVIILFAFLLCTIFSALSDASVAAPIVFFLFSCCGLFLLLSSINYRITYDNTTFTIRNLIGKETTFRYDQITHFKEILYGVVLVAGKQEVNVDLGAVGSKEFIAFVQEQYRLLHDGQDLPRAPKSRHDIFKSNVEFTGHYVIGYILVGVVLVCALLFLLWEGGLVKSSEANTLREELCFTSCAASETTIFLELPGQQAYRIQHIDETVDVTAIAEKCDGQTPLTVYSKEAHPRRSKPYRKVKALFYNGEELLSFEETDRLHRQLFRPLVLVAGVLTLLWGLFVVFSIVVGRNPQKFSQKTWDFFFNNKHLTPLRILKHRKESKQ